MRHSISPANRPDPKPVGNSLFIPFEGFNPRVENGQGKASFRLAVDLSPLPDIHAARLVVMNNPALASRIIEYREYSSAEIQSNPEIRAYVAMHQRN